ncbi:MAG: hypothetical protein J5865_02780 [Lachnospiraceae bacterium]|nr:hypothetical protein [Lachnospiraceae bacterium]
MIAYKITSNKDFAGQLFLSDTFDRFLLSEAVFNVPYTVSIDGSYTSEEGAASVAWGAVRGICTQLIKGKELPRSFHIVLKLSPENLARTLASIDQSLDASAVSGMYMNIRFEEDAFTLTTGTAVSDFSVMRRINEAWDRLTLRFFRSREIDLEEL